MTKHVASSNGAITAKITVPDPVPTPPTMVTLTLPLETVKAMAAVFGAGSKHSMLGYVKENFRGSRSAFMEKLNDTDNDWHYDLFDVCDEVLKATGQQF